MGIPDFQMLSNVSLLTITATVIVLFLGILYYAFKDKGLPPGPWGLPFLGYWPFLKDSTAHIQLQQLVKKYGDVYSFTSMGKLYIHLGTLRAIKEAHVTKGDCFAKRNSDFSVMNVLFGEGISCRNGESWKVQRKFIVQTFRELGLTSMKDYMTDSIYDSVHSTVQSLKAEGGKPVNLVSTLTFQCSAILRRTMFNDEGITEKELKDLLVHYEKVISIFTGTKLLLVGEFARHIIFPLSANYKPALQNREVMVDILKKIIKRHEATFDKDNVRDIIDAHIKERNERRSRNDPSSESFTENGLISSLIQFVGDGTLGICFFISYFIYILLEHPEEQENIFKELEEVIGPDRQPTIDDKSKLPYTNAFIQELLRMSDTFTLFPSLECTMETTLNDYKIPKGSITLMNLWSIHRDRNTFEDPDEFKPARYITKPGEKKTELPILFGIGKRSCVGEAFTMTELFLFLTTIVKNFRLSRPEGYEKKYWEENMEICAHPRN